MKELQERTEHLQCENNRLRAQVQKRRDLDERDAQDSGKTSIKSFAIKERSPLPSTM